MLDDRQPARVLAVYAHPDDADVACGGSLARWVDRGAEVHVLVCSRGEKGSSEPGADADALARRRAEELAAAADVTGAVGHEILGYGDGELDNTSELREELVTRVRSLQPDTVLTHDPTAVFFGSGYVSHHDHRSVGWAVLDACAPASGSPLYFPGAGPPHLVEAVYLSGTLEPDVWVDISDVVDRKVGALRCHRSQVGDDTEWVDEVVRERAAEAGAGVSVGYAEAFRRLVF